MRIKSLAQLEKALYYHDRALQIRLKVLGDDHLDSATSFLNIGNAHRSFGQIEKAASFYEKALQIFLKVYGKEHRDTAACFNNLGSAQQKFNSNQS